MEAHWVAMSESRTLSLKLSHRAVRIKQRREEEYCKVLFIPVEEKSRMYISTLDRTYESVQKCQHESKEPFCTGSRTYIEAAAIDYPGWGREGLRNNW